MTDLKQEFRLPDTIVEYLKENDGVNVAVNYNSAGADYGYAHTVWHSVVITRLTRTCHRCGYDPLWNPDDTDSKCRRHTYTQWRYDEVFAWSPVENEKTLEECFDLWLKEQSDRWYKPTVKLVFGRFDYK